MVVQKALRVPYKHVDGVPIPTDIYLPAQLTINDRRLQAPILIMLHGGAFMLGGAALNNTDQIEDCVERGWIVLSLEHRLCPGVDLLEGPMADVRDALMWAQQGCLRDVMKEHDSSVQPDEGRIMAMGTSSGGHLALSLAFDTPKPPLAILDFYGAIGYNDAAWSRPVDLIRNKLPKISQSARYPELYEQKHIIHGGMSLEGQAEGPPDFSDPRVDFAMRAIAAGQVPQRIWPKYPAEVEKIDPLLRVAPSWPPVCIVHGTADQMVPIELSRQLEAALKKHDVPCQFIEVEGEPHTFVGKMVKGSKTWMTQRQGFDFLERVLEQSYNS